MSYDYAVPQVIKVVDGDTVDLLVDLGFNTYHHGRFRLVIVDTPERGEPQWAEATAFTHSWLDVRLHEGIALRATTYKSDSFGRWLADIYDAKGDSLSSALLKQGYAVYKR